MHLNIFVTLWIVSLDLKIFSQINDFYLFKLCLIFFTNLFNILVIVFKKPNVTDVFINLVCLSINFTIFILNIIVLLCTLNSLTSLMNFSLSLNLLKTLPWWYAIDVMFFFLVQIISSYCFIMAAASLGFSLSAFSFNSCFNYIIVDYGIDQLLFDFFFAKSFCLLRVFRFFF